jgi:hypothetical protein
VPRFVIVDFFLAVLGRRIVRLAVSPTLFDLKDPTTHKAPPPIKIFVHHRPHAITSQDIIISISIHRTHHKQHNIPTDHCFYQSLNSFIPKPATTYIVFFFFTLSDNHHDDSIKKNTKLFL